MKARPKIVISSVDIDRLERLIDKLPRNAFMGRAELESELARANVVDR